MWELKHCTLGQNGFQRPNWKTSARRWNKRKNAFSARRSWQGRYFPRRKFKILAKVLADIKEKQLNFGIRWWRQKKSFIISLRKKTCTAQTRWCATFRYWVILNTVVYQSKNIFVNFKGVFILIKLSPTVYLNLEIASCKTAFWHCSHCFFSL